MAIDDFSGTTKESMNIIFLLDTSGSMRGARIQQLNNAMPDALNELAKVAYDEEADVFVRIIEFNDDAKWIFGCSAEEGIDISDMLTQWQDLTEKRAGTNTAEAIRVCMQALHTTYLGTRNYHPVVILVTDGGSDDHNETKAEIENLKKALAGDTGREKVQRIAIGVQQAKHEELVAFASTGTINHAGGTSDTDVPLVFEVDDVTKLTSVLKMAVVSSLYSVTGGSGDEGLVIEEEDWEA